MNFFHSKRLGMLRVWPAKSGAQVFRSKAFGSRLGWVCCLVSVRLKRSMKAAQRAAGRQELARRRGLDEFPQ